MAEIKLNVYLLMTYKYTYSPLSVNEANALFGFFGHSANVRNSLSGHSIRITKPIFLEPYFEKSFFILYNEPFLIKSISFAWFVIQKFSPNNESVRISKLT